MQNSNSVYQNCSINNSRKTRKRKRRQRQNSTVEEVMVPTTVTTTSNFDNECQTTNIKRKTNQQKQDHEEEERDITVLLYSKCTTYINGNESVESTSIRALLTKPRNSEETCSITLDPIHEDAEIHGFKIQYTPMQRYPRHTCIQLPCQHRFNGMALLIHCVRNTMTCPMCRAGLHESMDFFRTFPNEPWHEIMLNISHTHNAQDQTLDEAFPNMTSALYNHFGVIINNNNRNNHTNENLRNLIRLQPQSASLSLDSDENYNYNATGVDLRDGPVIRATDTEMTDFAAFAIFYLFRNQNMMNDERENNDSIAVSLNTSLQMSEDEATTAQPSYTVPQSFTMQLAAAIQNFGIHSISAKFIIRCRVNPSRMQLLTMPRISIPNQRPAILSADIASPIHAIRIVIPEVLPNDDNNNPSSRLNMLRMSAEDLRNHVEQDIMMHLLDMVFVPPDHNNDHHGTRRSRLVFSQRHR